MSSSRENIRETIVRSRKRRVETEGHTLGIEVPQEREAPFAPFGRPFFGTGTGRRDPSAAAGGHSQLSATSPAGHHPFCICEVKRRSPSKGAIALEMDAAEQAKRYVEAGIPTISVLTEEGYFGGSLTDLIAVKHRFPEAAVLRKDFLIYEEDIRVSCRAGADAVLLIASILTEDELGRMYSTARTLGLECLVEVHSEEDVKKASEVSPGFVGINARDLDTFRIDLTLPLKLRNRIGWDTRMVFESGVTSIETARFAFDSGFSGILVGEAAVRNPGFAAELARLTKPAGAGAVSVREGPETPPPAGPGVRQVPVQDTRSFGPSGFWQRLYARYRPGRPLTKICGICRPEDGITAAEAGADILGFVFADSPRRSEPQVPRALKGLDVLRVAVVVCKSGDRKLPEEVRMLLEEGVIDAVQFHGDETPEQCYKIAYPYYKAVRVRAPGDLKKAGEYSCPRVLLDAYTSHARGGTGATVDQHILSAGENLGLWLAGGLGPHNIRKVMHTFSPELVDLSSGLELFPGKKDKEKIVRFFKELDNGVL
mgnify:CR=1 FL=1